MKLFLEIISRLRWMLLLAIIAGIVGGLSSAGLIATINQALTAPANDRLAWSYFILCALMILARAASSLLVMHLGQTVILDLRLYLSRKIVAAPLRSLQMLGPARLLANLTDEIATLAAALESIPWICVNGTIVLGCLVYLGWLSQTLLALIMLVLVLGIASFQFLNTKALKALSSARLESDILYGHFRGLIDGIKELKLNRLRRHAFVGNLLSTAATRCRKQYTSGMTLIVLAAHWGNGLFYLMIGLILFILPTAVRESGGDTLTGYTLVLLYMMSPVSAIMDQLPTLSRAKIALPRLDWFEQDLASIAPEDLPGEDSKHSMFPGQLELINVSHTYHREREDRSFVLGPLNLVLRPKELVFIIGGNGSGKTTLALILVGLYAPETGEIRLNGKPVTDANREQYREHFSAVFSDFYVFENLVGSGNGQLDELARHYLAHLHLNHKVEIQNGSFSTVELSQGQRKRLALLSAYLEDRPFYVFDEWAADQDPEFKELFYKTLLPELKARGKTIVVITHDDKYFQQADRCIRLESGRITQLARLPEQDLAHDADKVVA